MKKEYSTYKYKNYITRIVILCIIPWIVPLVYVLTKESNEPFGWGYVIFPIAFSLFFGGILHFFRKTFLGKLVAFDIDWHTMYELDKRNEKNKAYNLKLLMNVHLIDGEFKKVLDCADELLNISSKPTDIYLATYQKIIALFFSGNIDEIPELITKQRNIIKSNKIPVQNDEMYYAFIENYLNEEYGTAIESISKILDEKNIEILNNKKVFVYHLMRMAYLKLGNLEQAENCTKQILLADVKHNTFFSKV